MTDPKKYLTISEVAASLPSSRRSSVHPATVRRWMLKGLGGIKLKYTKVGKSYCTTPEDLELFLQLLTRLHETRKS